MSEQLLGALVSALVGMIITGLLVEMRRRYKRIATARPPEIPDTPHRTSLTPVSDPNVEASIPPNLPLIERIEFLERARDTATADAIAVRGRGGDTRELEQHRTDIRKYLHSMAFLRPNDLVDDRYRLIEPRGHGRLAVIWKAYDLQAHREVALKILRYTCVGDNSIVQQFKYTAHVMSGFSTTSMPVIHQQVREIWMNGQCKFAYYVLELVDGILLPEYLERNPDSRHRIVDGLFEIARSLEDAHARDVVHRDIKPDNILVAQSGKLVLVDFDAVLHLRDRQVSSREMGTFGYSAPEVLDGLDGDRQADVFALGRVFSYVYYGQKLPSAYEKSVYEIVDLLNCGPRVKETLESAVSVHVSKRYPSMTVFRKEIEEAVAEEHEKRLPFLDTLTRERAKIQQITRHSFYGTLLLMLLARPIFAAHSAAQLSENWQIAIFHGIIGSLVWGTFISGAYLLFLIVTHRIELHQESGYALAMVFCALGGFLGGMLVSVPSVFVTNPTTLQCLGWLPSANGTVDRFAAAYRETRMMLAYPLTGLLTGVGTGACLHRGIELAKAHDPRGIGILPIPTKRRSRESPGGARIGMQLLKSPQIHLILLLPALFSPLVMMVLEPSVGAIDPAMRDLLGTDCPAAREVARTVGEGFIHYFGAVGLTAGFFYGVRTQEPSK